MVNLNNINTYVYIKNIINNRINEFNKLLTDEPEVRNQKIKKYIIKNSRLIFYLTIIGITLALLSVEYDKCSCIKNNRNLKGGSFTPTDMFGFLGTKIKQGGQYFADRVMTIVNFLISIVMIGLLIASPLFIYLFIIFMMFKFLIKRGMEF